MSTRTTIVPGSLACKDKTCAQGAKEARCLERVSAFGPEIENGILRKMDDAGMPCSGLGPDVTGSIGLTSPDGSAKKIVRFMYFGENGIAAAESPEGKKFEINGGPGSFPAKGPDAEKTVYVFPGPKDVLAARNLWKQAGLGTFPAYALSGFPLPPSFAGTEKVVLVNLDGRIADPEIIAEIMSTGAKGVSMSGRIGMNLAGLRDIYVSEPAGTLPTDEPAERVEKVGSTVDGRAVLFTPHGYAVERAGYSRPKPETNFAFLPKKAYVSPWPAFRRVVTADLYVNGKLEAENVELPGNACLSVWSMEKIAACRSSVPLLRLKETSPVAKAMFSTGPAKTSSFPPLPCVCAPATAVFPGFRLSADGFDPHPELSVLFSRYRENMDYAALRPETALPGDAAELARLFLDPNPSAKAATLGMCAWLYMSATALVGISHNIRLPKTCFEIHRPDDRLPTSASFLYLLFSGDPDPKNNAECAWNGAAKQKRRKMDETGFQVEFLPGLFRVDAKNRLKSARSMYGATKSPGLYAVTGSDMRYPVNAHGNIPRAVRDEGTEKIERNMPALRRIVLHLLRGYAKNAPRIDPDKWIVDKPELSVYDSAASALRELGFFVPGREWFGELDLNGGK